MDRFWNKVNKSAPGGCWEWTAGTFRDGYGKFRLNGKSKRAHRVVFELCVKQIPEDAFVCHHCDNPACVNPAHLYIGDKWSNMKDKVNRGRCHDQKGEKNFSSVLTENVVRVSKMYSSVLPIKHIAEHIDVKYHTLYRAVTGINWAHLD